jgi:2-polyprenyl-6-methoxyphenol hydroxylase-like FAD-dependent oxidoreductase
MAQLLSACAAKVYKQRCMFANRRSMGGGEIAVAGCGPAGLAAALLLKRNGHKVRLFERFEEPRPVGSGLMIQPTGLAVLRELGLAEALIAAGSRVDRLFGLAEPSGRKVLDVRYDWLGIPGTFGLGVHRASLFAVLYDAVLAAGIPIETGRTVAGSEEASGGKRRLLFAGGGSSAAFDLVVDCLGAASPLAPSCGRSLSYGALWASLDWPPGNAFSRSALEQRYVRASTMAGVLPIGTPPGEERPHAAFFWSLRADRLPAWREAGLEVWKQEVLALWPATAPLLGQIAASEELTFARYAHRTVRRPAAAAGLIHIGDSWHSTSPQLGQGANMALMDSWALAKALREERDLPSALAAAVRMRRDHVRLYQLLSALFTPAYQSDSLFLPWLRDRIVGPLARIWPATSLQAAMVAGTVGWPMKPLGLSI